MPATLENSLPISVERIALIMRYLLFALLSPLFFIGFFGGETIDYVIIAFIILAHNLFVHVAFWTRAYRLFFTPWNFFIYLGQITLIIAITGGESSDAYTLYHMLIIGFSAYDRRFRRVIQATLMCIAAYVSVIVLESSINGLSLSLGAVLVRLLGIFFIGWIIAALSERLRRAEITAAEQTAQVVSSEATLRAILNNSGDPMFVFDENEYVTDLNERALEFLERTREQVIGRRFRSFLFDDGTLPQQMADLRARGETRTEEIVITANGDERTVDMVARSYVRGGQRYFVALMRDLTLVKNQQDAALLAAQKLERLNAELRQLDANKRDFVRSMAVGLRSPLSAMASYVEMLLGEELGDLNLEQRKALQTCRRALTRVFRTLDQALDSLVRQMAPATARAESENGHNGPAQPPLETEKGETHVERGEQH